MDILINENFLCFSVFFFNIIHLLPISRSVVDQISKFLVYKHQETTLFIATALKMTKCLEYHTVKSGR